MANADQDKFLVWDREKTSATVTEVKFGHDNYGNGAYAILQFLADGDLMFNSIAGPCRMRLAK